ncbi:unnamed protein product, partial [Phaeothamnion confervicola]
MIAEGDSKHTCTCCFSSPSLRYQSPSSWGRRSCDEAATAQDKVRSVGYLNALGWQHCQSGMWSGFCACIMSVTERHTGRRCFLLDGPLGPIRRFLWECIAVIPRAGESCHSSLVFVHPRRKRCCGSGRFWHRAELSRLFSVQHKHRIFRSGSTSTDQGQWLDERHNG